jgi:hypothetical protein
MRSNYSSTSALTTIGVTDKAKALDIVARFPMPIPALASSAHLVEIPGGHTSIQLARE